MRWLSLLIFLQTLLFADCPGGDCLDTFRSVGYNINNTARTCSLNKCFALMNEKGEIETIIGNEFFPSYNHSGSNAIANLNFLASNIEFDGSVAVMIKEPLGLKTPVGSARTASVSFGDRSGDIAVNAVKGNNARTKIVIAADGSYGLINAFRVGSYETKDGAKWTLFERINFRKLFENSYSSWCASQNKGLPWTFVHNFNALSMYKTSPGDNEATAADKVDSLIALANTDHSLATEVTEEAAEELKKGGITQVACSNNETPLDTLNNIFDKSLDADSEALKNKYKSKFKNQKSIFYDGIETTLEVPLPYDDYRSFVMSLGVSIGDVYQAEEVRFLFSSPMSRHVMQKSHSWRTGCGWGRKRPYQRTDIKLVLTHLREEWVATQATIDMPWQEESGSTNYSSASKISSWSPPTMFPTRISNKPWSEAGHNRPYLVSNITSLDDGVGGATHVTKKGDKKRGGCGWGGFLGGLVAVAGVALAPVTGGWSLVAVAGGLALFAAADNRTDADFATVQETQAIITNTIAASGDASNLIAGYNGSIGSTGSDLPMSLKHRRLVASTVGVKQADIRGSTFKSIDESTADKRILISSIPTSYRIFNALDSSTITVVGQGTDNKETTNGVGHMNSSYLGSMNFSNRRVDTMAINYYGALENSILNASPNVYLSVAEPNYSSVDGSDFRYNYEGIANRDDSTGGSNLRIDFFGNKQIMAKFIGGTMLSAVGCNSGYAQSNGKIKCATFNSNESFFDVIKIDNTLRAFLEGLKD